MSQNLVRSLLKSGSDVKMTDEQLEQVSKVLRQEFEISPDLFDKIKLEDGPDEVIKIKHPDRKRPLYVDYTGEYNLKTGTKANGVPPEGRATNPNGEDFYGVR